MPIRPQMRVWIAIRGERGLSSGPVMSFFPQLPTSRRFLRCESGAQAIEFAMLSPMIIALFLAALQVALIFLAKAYLETATEAAARFVMTNQANSMTQSQFRTQVCNEIGALFNCANLIVQLEVAPSSASLMSSSMPQFNASGVLVNPTSFAIAAAPSKMMLIVMYEWPIFGGSLGLNFGNLGNGDLLMTATQIFQIEPTT
jgi:Flp pilus assembly protein TadG